MQQNTSAVSLDGYIPATAVPEPINRPQLYRAIRRGDVRAIRVGPRKLYVHAADVAALIAPVAPGGVA